MGSPRDDDPALLALLDELDGALLGTCVALEVGPTTSSSRTTFLSMAHTASSWTCSSGMICSSTSILMLAKLSIWSSEVSSLTSSCAFAVASKVPSSLSQLSRICTLGGAKLGPNVVAGPLGVEKLVDPVEVVADVESLEAFIAISGADMKRRPSLRLSLEVLQGGERHVRDDEVQVGLQGQHRLGIALEAVGASTLLTGSPVGMVALAAPCASARHDLGRVEVSDLI